MQSMDLAALLRRLPHSLQRCREVAFALDAHRAVTQNGSLAFLPAALARHVDAAGHHGTETAAGVHVKCRKALQRLLETSCRQLSPSRLQDWLGAIGVHAVCI